MTDTPMMRDYSALPPAVLRRAEEECRRREEGFAECITAKTFDDIVEMICPHDPANPKWIPFEQWLRLQHPRRKDA